MDNSICYKEQGISLCGEKLREIKLDNLHYFYGTREILSLDSLEIQKGKKYLIVGKSGEGKTTFLDILTKQKESKGVYVNGKDLEKIQFSSYVENFSYVGQDNDLLPFTFEQNITLGKKMNRYSIDKLISIFNLESVFDKGRDDLNFDYLNLSGGEKQRICLARALYSNFCNRQNKFRQDS